MSTGWNIYRIHYEKLTGLDGQMKGAGQKSDSPFFFIRTSDGVRFQIFNLLCPADLDHIACHAYLGDDLVQLQIACDGELD